MSGSELYAPAVVTSWLEDPSPAVRHYTATYRLDPSRAFVVADLLAAAGAFLEASVPVGANIQVRYGQAVLAMWTVREGEARG